MKESQPALHIRHSSQQQQYLLGVVYDLISERGIDAFTMRQVAEASGMSTGTINYHFKSKENLIISALEEAYQLPQDWEEYKGSPVAQLRRLALYYVFHASSNRWWRFWINCVAAGTRDEELQRHQHERFERQMQFWTRLIEDGMAKGDIRPDTDPAAAARDLLITVHGLLVLQLMSVDTQMRNLARERINQAIDQLLTEEARKGQAQAR
ncbi:MAG: TetR/AcrR family transcriptional regulator [Noviherbaspirillum sp.]